MIKNKVNGAPLGRTSTYFTPCSSVSIVNFEQVNAGWDCLDS